MLDRYAAFFRHRGVVRLTLFGFLARMPIGTVGIATLLHLRELTGSIAFAGAAVGTWFVASAVTAPIQGRLIDVRGPRSVLLVTGAVGPLAMLFVLFAGDLALPRWGILAAALVAGAFASPVTVVVRTVWRHRFDDEDARRTAYAMDGVLLEIAYTIGPALIAAIVALSGPQPALAMAWVFSACAVPMFFVSAGLRWWKRQPSAERSLLGPLHDARLVAVYLTTFFLSMGFGGIEVGYPGFATAMGSTPWGPALIAINSIGSAVGGVVYGGLRLSMPIDRQLPRLLVLFAAPIAVHAVLSSIGAMVPWALVAGLMIAPSMTAVAMIVSMQAPAKYATEAFTWSSTAIVTGIGVGMAISGALAERVGPSSPFAFTALAVATASVLSLRIASRPPR
jgi:MFS family permease